MFCHHCGSGNPNDAKFCTSCGISIQPELAAIPQGEAETPNLERTLAVKGKNHQGKPGMQLTGLLTFFIALLICFIVLLICFRAFGFNGLVIPIILSIFISKRIVFRNRQNSPKYLNIYCFGMAAILYILFIPALNVGYKNQIEKAYEPKLNQITKYSQPKPNPEKIKREADNTTLEVIWNYYSNLPGNRVANSRDVNVKGSIVKRGSVPPSAMNSSTDGRLPAYLACYDYISVFSMAGYTNDLKSNMCIYYIHNPVVGRSTVQWRGKAYIGKLEELMRNDGFVEE